MELKSTRFRQERETGWRDLEVLVLKAEKNGIRSLEAGELMRLPRLYRGTLSSLSVARAISLDRNLTDYLESLSTRAYFFVYGTRTNLARTLADFFLQGWPSAVRSMTRPLTLAIVAVAVGIVVGHVLTMHNPDWFYTLVDDVMASGRTPTASREYLQSTLFQDPTQAQQSLSVLATFLFSHNAKIAMLAFALGFALGIPTLLLLFYTGAMLGAMGAVFASKGLGFDFYGWVSIHGTTELLAVTLCGAAGLAIGGAVAFPGEHNRLAALASAGRRASLVVLGSVAMLFVAGLLEGFARQLIDITSVRYAIGICMLVLWIAYFSFVGHGDGDDGTS